MTLRSRFAFIGLILAVPCLAASCGDDADGPDAECLPVVRCASGEVRVYAECPDCRIVDDGCGGQAFCQADPTCTTPCPTGMFREYGTCDDPSCVAQTACGESIMCRDQASCLATTLCPDGGQPLESCAGVASGCLPTELCGTPLYCETLTDCARSACDPGEAASTQSCDNFTLPCRTIDACGTTLSCVCGSDALECREEGWTKSTSPCVPGEQCREVQACGQIFYCKGKAI